MKSYEVLKRSVDKVGAKRVAADLSVSTSLVYKWCEQAKEDPDDQKSGARNPLDRIVALMLATGDVEVIAWLCQQAGGFFVENPEEGINTFTNEYFEHTQEMINDFSRLLAIMSSSIRDDGKIDPGEAEKIRAAWENLKRYGEHFVTACEHGIFAGDDEKE